MTITEGALIGIWLWLFAVNIWLIIIILELRK